jgi:hypothetical protein
MFLKGDIALIIGDNVSGKTTFAKYLASTKDINFIYIDFIHTPYSELDELYEKNKNITKTILFDNFIEMRNNARRMNLFKHNKNFTLIFVMNYLSDAYIKLCDIIYFAKNNLYVDIYFSKISKYYNDKNNFINKMNILRDYGFLCIDKDNKVKFEEELIKLD